MDVKMSQNKCSLSGIVTKESEFYYLWALLFSIYGSSLISRAHEAAIQIASQTRNSPVSSRRVQGLETI
jgi:hypothetical protein